MDLAAEEQRRRFTVDEVMEMLRAGILDEDDRVELIEGDLLPMSPNDPPHAGPISRLTRILARAYGEHTLRVQLDLQLTTDTLVEPDFVVARGDESTYDGRHPAGRDCILVIEVSWSSKRRDVRKIALYARAGVAVYWILDVAQRQLETYERPLATGQYGEARIYGESDDFEIPGTSMRVKVTDLLPLR